MNIQISPKLEKLKSSLKKRSNLIFLVPPVVFLLAFFYIFPAFEAINNINVQISKTKKEIELTTAIFENLIELKKEFIKHKDDLEKLSYFSFEQNKMSPIYRYFENTIFANGLLLTNFSIGSQIKIKEIPGLTRYDFTFGLSGSYEALKVFFSALESNLRLVEPHTLSLTPPDGKDEKGLFNVNLEASVYVK